jgi:hypothetical protein
VTTSKSACPTAEDAVTQAMVAAIETITEPGILTEARFGQFSDGSGWHWTLTVTREIASNPGRISEDTLERRTRLVIEAWHRDVARYRQDFTPAEETSEHTAV